MIKTTKYVRKPLFVSAVRVTSANFEEVASWCQGEIQETEDQGNGPRRKFIKVRVHNPKIPRQTKAFAGDWILYTERGYKVYTNKAFNATFDIVEEDKPFSQAVEEERQRLEAGQPGTRVTEEAQEKSVSAVVEDPSPETGVQPTLEVEEKTPQGEPHEMVEVTPENIAQAVHDNEAARAVHDNEAARATESEEDWRLSPETSTQGHIVVDGKRILTLEEQEKMSAEELKELIQSGEVVLAQDLVA